MIGKIKEVDGEKKIEWIAGRAEGQGVPIGCVMAIYGNTAPNSSWLICDGSTFDAETYPALALYLGGNRLPDLRECVLVGAGESDNEYDASANPNGIHEHDVYTVGQFKDDQFQGHEHNTPFRLTNLNGATTNYSNVMPSEEYTPTVGIISDGTNGTPRTGTTTHGKQVGVNYIIKATSVSAETDHAAILAQIQRWNSYSTEETPTGKTWIDGKPIYRVVRHIWENGSPAAGYSISNQIITGPITTNAETITNIYGIVEGTNPTHKSLQFPSGQNTVSISWRSDTSAYVNYGGSVTKEWLVIEYTKTTD